MKAIVYRENSEFKLEDLEKPILKDREVLIKVSYAAICGSDLYNSSGKNPRIKPPIVLGHEFSGEIAEKGCSVHKEISIGDLVAVEPLVSCGQCPSCQCGSYHVCQSLRILGVNLNGGFAEYAAVSCDRVYKLPKRVSAKQSTLIEPMAVACHALRRSELQKESTIVILGAGPIGLLIALICRAKEAKRIILIEKNPFRAHFAREKGFTVIDADENAVSRVQEETNGMGADIVFESVGLSNPAAKSVYLAKIGGKVIIVGLHKEHVPMDLLNFMFKELIMIGSRVYNRYDFIESIELINSGTIDPLELVTHQVDMKNFQEGMNILREGKEAMKVLVRIR